MSTPGNFNSSSLSNFRRNFRRRLAIGAILFGSFAWVLPASAAPAVKPAEKVSIAFGDVFVNFLASLCPEWFAADEEPATPDYIAVVDKSETDSEIEIEPRNPRIPVPPPPVPFYGELHR